jgi:hypothetical protein
LPSLTSPSLARARRNRANPIPSLHPLYCILPSRGVHAATERRVSLKCVPLPHPTIQQHQPSLQNYWFGGCCSASVDCRKPFPPFCLSVLCPTHVERRTARVVVYQAEARPSALVQRRKLNSKAKFEGGSPYYGFKRLVPGAFNMCLIETACTNLPWRARGRPARWPWRPPCSSAWGPGARGLHSSTFSLNLSAFCGTRGECRGYLGGV